MDKTADQIKAEVSAAYVWADQLMDIEGQDRTLILEGLLTFLSDILDGDPQPLESYTRRFQDAFTD